MEKIFTAENYKVFKQMGEFYFFLAEGMTYVTINSILSKKKIDQNNFHSNFDLTSLKILLFSIGAEKLIQALFLKYGHKIQKSNGYIFGLKEFFNKLNDNRSNLYKSNVFSETEIQKIVSGLDRLIGIRNPSVHYILYEDLESRESTRRCVEECIDLLYNKFDEKERLDIPKYFSILTNDRN